MLAVTLLLIALVATLGIGAWASMAGVVFAVTATAGRPTGLATAAGGLLLFTGSASGLLELVRP